MSGEFLKINNVPDGRCRFRTNDDKLVILCYFKDGKKLKGPQLKIDLSKHQIEIKSKTWQANGHQVCTLAVIEPNKQGKTGYFVDKKLVKHVPYIKRHSLDWILAE